MTSKTVSSVIKLRLKEKKTENFFTSFRSFNASFSKSVTRWYRGCDLTSIAFPFTIIFVSVNAVDTWAQLQRQHKEIQKVSKLAKCYKIRQISSEAYTFFNRWTRSFLYSQLPDSQAFRNEIWNFVNASQIFEHTLMTDLANNPFSVTDILSFKGIISFGSRLPQYFTTAILIGAMTVISRDHGPSVEDIFGRLKLKQSLIQYRIVR